MINTLRRFSESSRTDEFLLRSHGSINVYVETKETVATQGFQPFLVAIVKIISHMLHTIQHRVLRVMEPWQKCFSVLYLQSYQNKYNPARTISMKCFLKSHRSKLICVAVLFLCNM